MRTRLLSLLLLATLILSSRLSAQDELDNLAPSGIARQSSDWNGQFPAPIAIDGNYGNFTATSTPDDNSLWEVEFPFDV